MEVLERTNHIGADGPYQVIRYDSAPEACEWSPRRPPKYTPPEDFYEPPRYIIGPEHVNVGPRGFPAKRIQGQQYVRVPVMRDIRLEAISGVATPSPFSYEEWRQEECGISCPQRGFGALVHHKLFLWPFWISLGVKS